MKKNLTLIILSCFSLAYTQKKEGNNASDTYKITYEKSSNGKLVENQDPIWLLVNQNQALITSEKITNGKSDFPYEQYLVYNKTNRYVQIGTLSPTKKITTLDSVSLSKQQFEITKDTKKILGYTCKRAHTVINSNQIDVWFTNDLKVYGGPNLLGSNLGLILELNRNNNFIITAKTIEKQKKTVTVPTIENQVDLLTYKDLLWKSRFKTLNIFEEELINYTNSATSNDSILRFANGTIILKKVKFPKIQNGSQIFVDVKEQSNGDAYDRTGCVFAIPANKGGTFLNGLQNGVKSLPVYTNGNGKEYHGMTITDTFTPPIELMRFFTPFGINKYNSIELKNKKWHEYVTYRQDISDFNALLNDQEVWIGAFIGNYDKGGHKISLNITIHKNEFNKAKNEFILPLFNTNNIMEMAGQNYPTMFDNEKGLTVEFTLAKDIQNAKLRYTSTGHGGWENGDEFVQKVNTIYLDNSEVFSFIPWRTDCGSYRLFNPASGNFENGLSSSDYSRSNWCPGTVTNPNIIPLGNLKAGKHTIQVKIPQGKPEGGSFSAWIVSGVLMAE